MSVSSENCVKRKKTDGVWTMRKDWDGSSHWIQTAGAEDQQLEHISGTSFIALDLDSSFSWSKLKFELLGLSSFNEFYVSSAWYSSCHSRSYILRFHGHKLRSAHEEPSDRMCFWVSLSPVSLGERLSSHISLSRSWHLFGHTSTHPDLPSPISHFLVCLQLP